LGRWKSLLIDGKEFLYDLDYDRRERDRLQREAPGIVGVAAC
jgi:hypothetical protein